nr:BC1881 family protein [uncultured Anaerostipes sp.]
MNLLKSIKTAELVEELKRREGVRTEYAEPHTDKKISVNGPAEILIVID